MTNTSCATVLTALLVLAAAAAIVLVNGAPSREEEEEEEESINVSYEWNATLDAYTVTQAEDYFRSSDVMNYECEDSDTNNFTCMTYISNGDFLFYRQVDFGSVGAQWVSLRLHSGIAAGRQGLIRLVLDEQDATPFHNLPVASTDLTTPSTWITLTAFLDFAPAARGVHDLYIKFVHDYSDESFVDFDWFQFFQ